MNDPSQMLSRTFGMWQQQPQQQQQPQPQAPLPPLPPQSAASSVTDEPMGFQNSRPVFAHTGAKPGRANWNNNKRKQASAPAGAGSVGAGPGVLPSMGAATGISGYKPPTLTELQYQNRLKARRFYPKKKFSRFAPFAPRNTTSFIIRAKKSGGIASLVSPCPVTPAILPTPTFSPSREGLVDMAKEEWGVDGYGSMKGLIRLRSPTAGGSRSKGGAEEDDDVEDGSSESDVEEHVEVERRLDHDLSRFEIVYPSYGEEQGGATSAAYLLENRVDDQDTHIAQLEEENLTLKERLFLMEREMGELRRRLMLLETDYRLHNERNNNNNEQHADQDDNLNAKEETSENDGGGDLCSEKSVGDCEESCGIPLQE
ncbi:uncharacterized protein LOC110094828 [Dendrobium catenatum]|uniref:PRLI-interacting factor A n=1 Tax=Dendrobium catenatum TaxID=906689 RepID=A0A2I0V6Y0_9ASPA|nr:uncharacterized protein LOC110094828 [Dendrobium catenatum]PKU59167.1 hypothetical protein MA16_Dca023153 [Dendrobium catenatum]